MIKRLLKSIREYKKESLLSPLFMILEVSMEVIIPILIAKLIDFGIQNQDMAYILKIGAILTIFCLLTLTFGSLSGIFAAKASSGFAKNLRKDLYYNIQNFSFSNIDKFSISSIITRLTTDVTNVQNSYQMIIRVAVRGFIMLIFSSSMAFLLKPKLSFIFIIAILILTIGIFSITKYAFPLYMKILKTYDRLNSIVQENLHGIRVVKSFVREDFEEKKFKNVSGDIYGRSVKTEKIIALMSPLMQFVIYLCMLGLSWFGAKMIVNSTMTTGELMTLITYAFQMLMSLMMISMLLVMLVMSKASAERISEVLIEEPDIRNAEEPIFEFKNGDIQFKNVNFSYAKDKTKLCLKDIDLNIKEGEVIGIIGATGSAKTSFVQLIPRLYDVFSGEVLVGGVNVKDYDLTTLRKQVAMVLQKNILFSGTLKENLRWGNESATDEEIINACKIAQAHSFIDELPEKYDTFAEQGGANFSGGQKQRICIARALLQNPKILILDDSTSAIDTKTDALIREALKKEMPNTTKIIIAQRIISIEHADRIIVLNEGKIDAIGSHNELIQNNSIYKEFYELQSKGGFADE